MEIPIANIWSLPNAREALTIFAMFCATYSTRLIGWLLLRNRTISPAFRRALEAAPGCVMAAIVAPQFMTTNPVTLHRRSRCRVVAQHGRNRDCFDAGLCRIEQLDLREKTDLFFVTPFSILELSLPSFFPQFSFKFGVILENNRSLKKQRLRIY